MLLTELCEILLNLALQLSKRPTAERSYPTSKVRGISQEDTMPEGWWARGVTPRPRSRAVAESARLQWRRNSGKELHHVRGQGQRPGRATPRLRSGAATERSYPTSEVRGSSQECQAATAQEQQRGATPHSRSGAAAGRSYSTSEVRGSNQEERPHVQGQGRQPGGATPRPRSGGCVGAEGPRGDIS